jgi:hypothetical protein
MAVRPTARAIRSVGSHAADAIVLKWHRRDQVETTDLKTTFAHVGSVIMTSTAITDPMRNRALVTAARIIRLAQTNAKDHPEGGHDLSLALLRMADPLAYREVLDAVTLLEAQGFARRWRDGLCTIYAVRRLT